MIQLILCRGQPWFVSARPIEVIGQGVETEVVVRWTSSEVYAKVPASVDGFTVEVVLEGQSGQIIHLH
ncbi:MAG: hypothetical protein QM704_00635 [Anaeromyxobacteraceae bacterium]